MASEGPNYPGTVNTSNIALADWSNASNVTADDDSVASHFVDSGASDTLLLTNFGFSIPTGATIDGVEVEIERRKTGGGIVRDTFSVSPKLLGVTGGSSKHSFDNWPGTLTVATYGGATDLWNATISVEQVNDSSFGVQISATEGGEDSAFAEIDFARITVYYTEGEEPETSPGQLVNAGLVNRGLVNGGLVA